ncbi:MAG: hypothetical protein FJ276_14185 [Planctomycetes bacterium]|nr:hypothetical protein [Planctomycetota bacterium]
MTKTTLPTVDLQNPETGCCPRFEPAGWDREEFAFEAWPFVRATTVNFMHIPLNMGSVMKKTYKKIMDAGAAPKDTYLCLSTDPSPWRGEHYFFVTKDVPDSEMVKLSGKYLARVFEGPYQHAGKWAKEMVGYVRAEGKTMRKLYFFYTTCPKCMKHYGKNYVVAFAEI